MTELLILPYSEKWERKGLEDRIVFRDAETSRKLAIIRLHEVEKLANWKEGQWGISISGAARQFLIEVGYLKTVMCRGAIPTLEGQLWAHEKLELHKAFKA